MPKFIRTLLQTENPKRVDICTTKECVLKAVKLTNLVEERAKRINNLIQENQNNLTSSLK